VDSRLTGCDCVMLKDGVTSRSWEFPRRPVLQSGQADDHRAAGVQEEALRRWEFMRLPGEKVADMEREDRVWDCSSPWRVPRRCRARRQRFTNSAPFWHSVAGWTVAVARRRGAC